MFRYYREKLHVNHFWELKGKATTFLNLHVCLVVAEGGGGGGGGLMKWTDILRFEIFLAVGISVP